MIYTGFINKQLTQKTMKKLLLLFAVMFTIGLTTANAQITDSELQEVVDAINNDVTAVWTKNKGYEDVEVYGLPALRGLETCYTFLIQNPITGGLYYKHYGALKPNETSGGLLCSDGNVARNVYKIQKRDKNAIPTGYNEIWIYSVWIQSTGEAANLYGHSGIEFIKQ